MLEDNSIQNKAWMEANYKVLEAATILLYAAKKLTKQSGKEQTIDMLNNQAIELLNTIEEDIVRIFLDDNDRLDYMTKEGEIDARICAAEYRDEHEKEKHDSLYDEATDIGMGTYLCDGVYVQPDGSLVDTKCGR